MTPLLSVKVSSSAPSGATAVGELAFSDRLTKIPGVKKAVAERAGFTGSPGSVMALHEGDTARIVVGAGPAAALDADALSRAVAAFVRFVSKHRRVAFDLTSLDLPAAVTGNGLDEDRILYVVAESAILAAYSFTELKSDSEEGPRLDALTIATAGDVRSGRAAAARAAAVAEGVCFARDLVNLPGGDLTPPRFAMLAEERAIDAGLEVEVFGEDEIREMGLGGVLAVNKGSTNPPRLVRMTYTPDVEETGDLETLVLVGKGITFDSGGLSLKSPEAMIGMKMDMGGAAAVIGAMCALPAVQAPVRVVSLTPMTDNMTGGDAQRPGDVYTARGGTTVEVLNTDAEGRLILGDALVLASEEEPAGIVDLATLTGACMVALGERIAGLMGNDDDFRGQVAQAAARAGERVWEMPLPADYRKQLDSDVADLKNIGTRYGGSLTAGLFLKEFVGEGIPWAHLDIAGPAMGSEAFGVAPKGGTGFGVRTLVELASSWGAEDHDPEDDGAAEEA